MVAARGRAVGIVKQDVIFAVGTDNAVNGVGKLCVPCLRSVLAFDLAAVYRHMVHSSVEKAPFIPETILRAKLAWRGIPGALLTPAACAFSGSVRRK
jgi:hypothetical protein